jgi:hypothetical protein
MRKCQALGVKRQWAAVWYVTDVFFAFPAHNFNTLTQHIRHWGPTDFKICMCRKEEATTDFEWWWPNDSGPSWFFYANCDEGKRWMILVAFDSTVRWLSGFFYNLGFWFLKKFGHQQSSSSSGSFENFHNWRTSNFSLFKKPQTTGGFHETTTSFIGGYLMG